MKIRPARADDAPAICDLHNQIIRETDATFTTVLRDPGEVAAQIKARLPAFLVAQTVDGAAGFATFGAFRAGPGYGATCEHTVILHPGARGQGVGRALMHRLVEVARAEGMHVMVAGVSGTNPGAVRFHERLGFVQVAHMPEVGRKNGVWLDLILLQCSLRPPDTGEIAG